VSAIVLTDLVKQFGQTTALAGVTLTVPAGSIFGFLGPNGAGKTTTLRILTGLARPTSGTASVLDVHMPDPTTALRRLIGYLPDVPAFYPWMTAREVMQFAGRLFGMPSALIEERTTSLLDMAGLGAVRTRVGGFSRGMKQRLGIAQALINAPRLLLLDEPTSALDPMGRRDVLEMIAALRGRTTVFFSTHILADVERVCDTVAILDRGRVVAGGPIAELKRRYSASRLAIQVDGDIEPLADAFAASPWLSGLERAPGFLRLTVTDLDAARRDVLQALARSPVPLRRFEVEGASLEDVFVELLAPPAP
jgi:ABC-2 type transport system ATP-binding protein